LEKKRRGEREKNGERKGRGREEGVEEIGVYILPNSVCISVSLTS
jgi:hypothetical protein